LSSATSSISPGSLSPGHTPTGSAQTPSRLRLAAFDLDGTLLAPDLTIPDRAAAALRALAGRGVRVVIVTGRMHRTAEGYARRLGLEDEPLVSFNGAMAGVVGRPETWWHRTIPAGLAREVVRFLRDWGLEPLVFSGDGVYAGAPSVETETYGRVAGIGPCYVGDLAAWLGREDAGAPLCPTKILQVEATGRMPDLFGAARERFGHALNVTTSYSFFLEFMDAAASKGRALAEVCRRLGVDRQEVAAFGDGLNDLDMIQWAGLGVAMAHSPPALLEAADRVADGPPGEGVARFIEENLL